MGLVYTIVENRVTGVKSSLKKHLITEALVSTFIYAYGTGNEEQYFDTA